MGTYIGAAQFFCSEEQTAEAEGLPIPFSNWEPREEKIRDVEWTVDCTTPGEECDYFHICVDRFDQHDVTGDSFIAGKHCLSKSQVTEECYKKIQWQFTFEVADLDTRDSNSYRFRENIYCPNFDPTPRAFWEAEQTITWPVDYQCETDSDCNQEDDGHYCLKQMSSKAFEVNYSGIGCAKKSVC